MRIAVLLSLSVLALACNRAGEGGKADKNPGAEQAPSAVQEPAAGSAADQPAQATTAPAKADQGKKYAEPGEPVPAFELSGLDLSSGEPVAVSLSSTERERPTAYAFVGISCKTTAKYLGRLAELEKAYADKVDFVYLYPNRTDPPEGIEAFHKQHELTGPLFIDKGAQVAAMLGRSKTAEVVVVGKDESIVYAGAIDDNKDESAVTRKHLAIALDEHLAGKPVSQPKTLGTA